MPLISRRLQDKLFAPLTLLSALWLRKVRANIKSMPVSKRALLKAGVFPILDRYWEPLFDPRHLRHSLRDDRHLPGLDLNIRGQLELLRKLVFASELSEGVSFNYENGNFEAGDAEFLYAIIRYYKPKRIVEIGSGHSTRMAMKAVNANRAEDSRYSCEHICIEPYECPWLDTMDIALIRRPVEEVDKKVFSDLDRGDLLFIDSSHMVRPQGDVLYEIMEILPQLVSGVIIHFHDIFTPKDYPDEWLRDEVRFWNEQYILEAFLSYNEKFKVIAALNYLKHHHLEELVRVCPILKNSSQKEPGSIYLVRI